MLQSIDKKKNIYIYLFLLFFLTTIYNFNIKNFFQEKFKIINIDINDDLIVPEIKNLINKNILYLNENEIIKNFEKYPILSSFKVNKIYPNTLKVEIYKTKHLAKIIKNQKIYYIGENGKLFEDKNYNSKVPTVLGNVEIKTVNKFLGLLKKSLFDLKDIDTIVFYPSKRWDIVLVNKKIIKLPENNVLKFIKKAKVLLNNKNFDKKIIDLRIKNKIILSNG